MGAPRSSDDMYDVVRWLNSSFYDNILILTTSP